MNASRCFAALLFPLLTTPAFAGTLTTTTAGGNSMNGNMFEINATNALEIDSFDIYPDSSGTMTWEVYTTTSAVASVAGTSSAWTMVGTGSFTASAGGTPQHITLTSPVSMAAGSTMGWYITSTSTRIQYTNGSSFGAVYVSNADLSIEEGYGMAYAFGSIYTPRVWNGTVYYTACSTTYYADSDGDGYGSLASGSTIACSVPSGYAVDDTDCDDTAAAVNPAASEVCDGDDNDCDGAVDESTATDASVWYADVDGDGYGDAGSTEVACTQPTDYVADDTDCDDAVTSTYPGADEYCDGDDNNCDGTVDESTAVDAAGWYADADADGYGDPGDHVHSCSQPAAYVSDGSDCDDTEEDIYPGADEYCDGHDNDCDGTLDESSALDAAMWYYDGDGDTYGDAAVSAPACDQPTDYVSDATDCDDAVATTFPGATETCNGADDDCDGTTDEASAADAVTWYADTDGDSYGDAAVPTISCEQPADAVLDATDCDDTVATSYPGATELCNGTDDNCDGTVDEASAADAPVWYYDGDTDGYGDAVVSEVACDQPADYVSDATDCDDAVATSNPAAAELCNGADDNCDGTIDETTAADASTWYADTDADGYGDAASSTPACSEPAGYIADNTDCDDTNGDRFPGNPEVWYDGTDQDCDGADDDQDADGFALADDCDDTDAASFPGATDAWYDEVDSDCAGNSDFDADADGYDSQTYGGDDCDDALADTYPGAPDDPYDGVVTDCGNVYEYDADQDGHTSDAYGGDDCDDANSDMFPGNPEVWYDGTDQDCDGADDDQDADGFVLVDDCDDTRADVNPDAAEVWYDGVDQDCDGHDDDQDADGVLSADDCDDTDAAVNPNTEEIDENGVDDDCDGVVDVPVPDDNGGEPNDTGDDAKADECGCAATPSAPVAGVLLGLLGLTLRRRSTR